MVDNEHAGTESPETAAGQKPDLEYQRPPGRFDSWERVDWIIAAARLTGLAVIILGVANVINLAFQTRGAPGTGTTWLQFASFAVGSASTGLLLIVAAEILDHLLGRDDG